MKTSGKTYMPPSMVDKENYDSGEITPGLWRDFTDGIPSVTRIGSNNYRREAEEIRKTYATYFCGDGALPWQWKRVGLDTEYVNDSEDEDMI